MKPWSKTSKSAEPYIDRIQEKQEFSSYVKGVLSGLVIGFVLGILFIFITVYKANF